MLREISWNGITARRRLAKTLPIQVRIFANAANWFQICEAKLPHQRNHKHGHVYVQTTSKLGFCHTKVGRNLLFSKIHLKSQNKNLSKNPTCDSTVTQLYSTFRLSLGFPGSFQRLVGVHGFALLFDLDNHKIQQVQWAVHTVNQMKLFLTPLNFGVPNFYWKEM